MMKWLDKLLSGNSNNVESLFPHEIFPEILDWHEGDELQNCYNWGFSSCKFISVNAEGYVFADHFGDKIKFQLKDVMKFRNQSLRNRVLSSELKNSDDYMLLLAEFQRAVEELQKRDKLLVG